MLSRKFFQTIAFSIVFLGLFLWLTQSNEVLAQGSLGVGQSEQSIQPKGMFAGLLYWIQQQQQDFYKAMVDALKDMKTDTSKIWWLVGLCFAYGIFHAAGPGHGKAIISSYMLANEVAAKRGITLAFASAILQGLAAITVIVLVLLFLRGVGIRTTNLTRFLEVSSYFAIMMLGIYLLWRKVFNKGHSHDHDHDHTHSHDDGHHHSHDEGCGHLHAPDPKQLEGTLGSKEAISAILAVGLRPCTGAIVVLSFAFLNGLYLTGILSTFAMSFGTGITVAALAILAVFAKNTAVKVAGLQDRLGIIHRIIEITGAFIVFLLGFLLFTAAIST